MDVPDIPHLSPPAGRYRLASTSRKVAGPRFCQKLRPNGRRSGWWPVRYQKLACAISDWNGPSTQIEVDGAAAIAATSAGLPRRGSIVIRPDMHVAQIVDG